jgi:mRNA interferase MazF
MGVVTRRFEIYLVNLDPTIGSEIRKTRPCVVISPDEANERLHTVLLAPMTTKGRAYPTRVSWVFQGKSAQIVLDQIRAVDRVRLVKRLGHLTERQSKAVLAVLQELFAE